LWAPLLNDCLSPRPAIPWWLSSVRPPLNLLSLCKTGRRVEVPFRCRGLGRNGRDPPQRRVKERQSATRRGNDPCFSLMIVPPVNKSTHRISQPDLVALLL